MNQTISSLHNRSSIRKYLDKPISNLDISQINGAIYRSPTAGNMQDFSVIIVSDQTIKDQLAILCDNQLFIKSAPLLYISLSLIIRVIQSILNYLV